MHHCILQARLRQCVQLTTSSTYCRFEPCGYSMNGMDGAQASTIHITPETGFSYASVEVFCQV